MKQEIKKRWIDALRSGGYPQGRGRLECQNGTFCCAGVLCHLAMKEGVVERAEKEHEGNVYVTYDRYGGVLPQNVTEWAGVPEELKTCAGPTLYTLNDQGLTFNQIADIIEKEF